MREQATPSLERIRELVAACQELGFEAVRRAEVYESMERPLRQSDYPRQGRAAKGLLRRYVAQMTGRSRAQVTRLIQRYCQGEPVAPAAPFTPPLTVWPLSCAKIQRERFADGPDRWYRFGARACSDLDVE